jgi:tRNA A-37 threonylcarbamoyl transferase component Bud32
VPETHPHADEGAKVGDQIGGYRLLRLLGDGSTSSVFLGEHVRLGRKAAIKVLASDLTDDERTVRRLITEARVVNDIRHPNIIDISDFVEQDEPRRVALVMEYVEGPSLKSFRGRPLTYPQALALCIQLVDAVQAAHSRGVIHRDLKPDNLLLTADPALRPDRLSLKVVDFGIAKIAGPNAQGMTVSGTMLGTPAYMAPEQIAGSPAPSPATDVFALGAVIYEMVTGERAYPSPRLQETVRAKLRGELPELKVPAVPGGEQLVEVVRSCLARHPDGRPTLVALRQSLNELLKRASGDMGADLLDLPTMGLTSALRLPGAATELSEVPAGALAAARQAAMDALEAETELPELMRLMAEAEDDDEDLGTELVRPSLDHLPAMHLAPTEQAAPRGIPVQHTVATQRVLGAITDELEPYTAPSAMVRGGLLGPAGVASELDPELRTRTNPSQDGLDPTPAAGTAPPRTPASGSAVTEPPAARRRAEPNPEPRPKAQASLHDEPPPDRLFASAVGLAADSPSPQSLPALMPPPTASPWRWVLWLVLAGLVAATVLGVGVLMDWVPLPRQEAPQPTPAPAPQPEPPAPTAVPR